MFAELLDRVLHQTPGAVAVTLMGFDGIAIESRERDGGGEGAAGAQAAVIELSAIAKDLRRIAEGLDAGGLSEVMVRTGALTTVLRPLTEEYFLALSLAPDAYSGKGRYLMRVVAPKLVAELA